LGHGFEVKAGGAEGGEEIMGPVEKMGVLDVVDGIRIGGAGMGGEDDVEDRLCD